EVLARELRDLDVRAWAELLPRLVEPPEPPREPAARALEERAAKPGMPLEHAAGGHAREGEHQLHRVAGCHADDAPVRMIQVAPGDVVAQRGLARRVEADRDLELLDRAPEGLELRVVDVAAVHRVGITDHRDGA